MGSGQMWNAMGVRVLVYSTPPEADAYERGKVETLANLVAFSRGVESAAALVAQVKAYNPRLRKHNFGVVTAPQVHDVLRLFHQNEFLGGRSKRDTTGVA